VQNFQGSLFKKTEQRQVKIKTVKRIVQQFLKLINSPFFHGPAHIAATLSTWPSDRLLNFKQPVQSKMISFAKTVAIFIRNILFILRTSYFLRSKRTFTFDIWEVQRWNKFAHISSD